MAPNFENWLSIRPLAADRTCCGTVEVENRHQSQSQKDEQHLVCQLLRRACPQLRRLFGKFGPSI